jgi:pimeloyl-ACP methyl ester carboxylesterase
MVKPGKVLKGVMGVAGGIGALAATNAVIDAQVGEVESALRGETRYFAWDEGDIFYKLRGPKGANGQISGTAVPIMLLHGINTAASSYEMRRIFEPLAGEYIIYALDLLGFGQSDRPPLEYDAELYVRLISEFAREVIGSGRGIVLVASSLTGAFAIEAAARQPELFGKLALIEPTGIRVLAAPPTPAQYALYNLLRSPIVGDSIFNALTSKPGLSSFLKRDVYANPDEVTAEMVAEYHTAAHQEGGKYALAAFIGGRLNLDIADSFASLKQPILITWGREATITPVWQLEDFLDANPQAEGRIIAHSGLLPHDEQAAQWLAVVRDFLGKS